MKRKLAIACGLLYALASAFVLMNPVQIAHASAAIPLLGKTTYIHNNNVWISNADGSNAVQLTNDGGRYNNPVFSPDHSKIAMERWQGSVVSRIYTIDVGGANLAQLSINYKDYTGLGNTYAYGGNQFRPRWSPDGSRVAFYSVEFVQPGVDPYYLFDAPLGGQGSYYHNGMNPEYSPDGSYLGYVVHDPSEASDYWHVKRVNRSNNSIVSMYRTNNVLGQFDWSPNSQNIAVEEATGAGQADITLLDATKSYAAQVPSTVHSVSHNYLSQPRWSHGGTRLVMSGAADTSRTDILTYSVAADQLVSHTATNSATSQTTFGQWSDDDGSVLANYSDSGAGSNRLAVINLSNDSFNLAQVMPFALAGNRDVKDWYGQSSGADLSPQALGANTDQTDTSSGDAVQGTAPAPPDGGNNDSPGDNTPSDGGNNDNQPPDNTDPDSGDNDTPPDTASDTHDTSEPQVLGLSTTADGNTSIKPPAPSKPQVLADSTTLPSTGFAAPQTAFASIGGMTAILSGVAALLLGATLQCASYYARRR